MKKQQRVITEILRQSALNHSSVPVANAIRSDSAPSSAGDVLRKGRRNSGLLAHAALMLIVLPCLSVLSTHTSAQETESSVTSPNTAVDSFLTRNQLTGDWWGARTDLADHGLTFDLSYTGFYQGQFSGSGDKDFEYGGRFDALISIDTGKLGLWEGGGIHTHLEYNGGDAPFIRGGALLPVNLAMGLPVGQPEKLVSSSLYYSHGFGQGTSMLIGKINTIDLLASDSFYGGWGNTRFMNVAFVAPLSGVIPPTIMGVIVNHRVDPITWTLMVFDPNDQTDNYSLSKLFSDGANISLAGTWSGKWSGRPSSLNMQGVYSTKDKADLADFLLPPDLQTNSKDGSWHFSVKATHLILQSSSVPGQGLGIYAKAGISDGNPNPFQAFFTGGIAGHNLVPGRPDDVFGLGYFYYNFSNDLQSAVEPVVDFRNEHGFEAFYNFAVTPWFHLSADLQWIDPANGMSERMLLGSLRAGVTF